MSTVMLSVICAIPCSQAEFTFPPFENDRKLQGGVLYSLCCCRGCRRSGGPRTRGRCGARATVLGCASVGVWLCARLWRPLVAAWAALHDLWRFWYALLEMCAMVCGILCGPVVLRNAGVGRA